MELPVSNEFNGKFRFGNHIQLEVSFRYLEYSCRLIVLHVMGVLTVGRYCFTMMGWSAVDSEGDWPNPWEKKGTVTEQLFYNDGMVIHPCMLEMFCYSFET